MLSTSRIPSLTAAFLLVLAASGVDAQVRQSPSERPADPTCPVADGPSTDLTYNMRKSAFDAIEAHNAPAARHLMRCAIQKDPKDQIALRQEVYLDLDAGDSAGAIGDIDALRSLGVADAQLEAQEGYIYAEKKNYPAAKAAFRRAIETGDSDIRFQAFEALGNLSGGETNRFLSVDVDSQYLNRFDDGIVDATVHFNQRLGNGSPFRAYLNTRLLRDTASHAGVLPEIIDDNAFLAGVGVAFQPATAHYALSAEANEAYLFYAGRNFTSALVPDFRVVAGYYNIFRFAAHVRTSKDFRPGGLFHPGTFQRLGERISLQANGSIGFYSRYQHDVIAYLQPQENYEAVRSGPIRITPYLQENIALDTNQQYYNNIGEIIPGVSFASHRLPGVAFRTEYVRGYYLPFHTDAPNPYGGSYNDFRFHLVWSRDFSLEKGGR